MLHSSTLSVAVIWIYAIALLTAEDEDSSERRKRRELARAHYNAVYSRIQCADPIPMVFPIKLATKRYSPPATILHRCGESSGCCESSTQLCAPKTTEKVRLYFFETFVRHGQRKQKVRKMTFTNHTECHCMEAVDIPR